MRAMVSRISTLRSVGVLAHRGASWWATASPPNRIAPVPMRAMTGSFSSAIEQLLAVARGTPGSGGMDPKRTVPPHIPRPDYAEDGVPKGSVPKLPWKIPMNSAEDIACAREAGRISREVHPRGEKRPTSQQESTKSRYGALWAISPRYKP